MFKSVYGERALSTNTRLTRRVRCKRCRKLPPTYVRRNVYHGKTRSISIHQSRLIRVSLLTAAEAREATVMWGDRICSVCFERILWRIAMLEGQGKKTKRK